jgi:hypothetical protein
MPDLDTRVRLATFAFLDEHWGFGNPTRAGAALGLVGAGFVGAALWRQHGQRAWSDVVFDEPSERETQRLGISSGTD